jgi:DNA-binding transcriptional MocR family regulator
VRQIASEFADRINRGELPPGVRLPSERALAAQRGVHRSTAALAYAELEADGLVERRRGSGTTVTGDLWGVSPDWPRYLADSAFRPTAGLLQRIREARQLPGAIDLSEGSVGPDLLPTTLVNDLLGHGAAPPYPDLDLGYSAPLGDLALRRAIAEDFACRHGTPPPDPATILITAGAQQALYLIARVLLRPGDAVAVERPSYAYSLPLFQGAGLRLVPLPMDGDGVDPAGLRPLAERHRLRLAIVNPTFQNPTTTTMPTARRRQLLAACRALNLPLVEDDAYARLAGTVSGVSEAPPPLKALDADGRVLHIGTLSKAAAPGLRIGWMMAPAPVASRLADAKLQVDFGADRVAQWLAARLVGSAAWETYLASLRSALRARREVLARELAAAFGAHLSFATPAGGMYLWARWATPGDDRRRLDAAAHHGVVIAPGRLYGAADGFVRLTFARGDEATLVEAVRRLWRATLGAEGGSTIATGIWRAADPGGQHGQAQATECEPRR